jgi:hypothetical protein
MTDSPSVRARVPWLRLALVALVLILTLAQGAETLFWTHPPTAQQRRSAEIAQLIAARRARIAKLLAEGDGCHPALAHELAKALVFDGQSARDYAADYERRCGEDPVLEHWGAAPVASARWTSAGRAFAAAIAAHRGSTP